MILDPSESLLLVVDMQPAFMAPIHRIQSVQERVLFLVKAAQLLGVPVLHTEQYPERMGGTEESIQAAIGRAGIGKMAFSCMGEPKLVQAFEDLGRTQVIICGIETHICVNQTAHDLMEEDVEVVLASDAISARSAMMHQIGMDRLKELGCTSAHSESILYEWLETASHPSFKQALNLVKTHPAE